MENVLLLARLVAVALSFWGLCALAGKALRVEAPFAPLAAASLIIVVLMIAGLCGALPVAWWALFLAGAGGWLWLAVRRRLRVGWTTAALALIAVYAVAHYCRAYYGGSDSISHWGMIVKYMVRADRFPNAGERVVFFKSYPPASACFIYFFCRGVGYREGFSLAAQFVLYAVCLLPVCGLAEKNRLLAALAVVTLGLLMVFRMSDTQSLQVDVLIPCMAVGGIASALRYGGKPGRARALPLITAVALVWVKASGALFAAAIAFAAAWAARGEDAGDRRRAWRWPAILLAAVVAAFAIWQLHVKVAFGAESAGKHALSLSNYEQAVSEKTPAFALDMAKQLVRYLLWPGRVRVAIRLGGLAVYGLCALDVWLRGEARAKRLKALGRLFLVSAALYVGYFAMLYLMYLFSMPAEEAGRLASISRYEASILGLDLGLLAIRFVRQFCRGDFAFARRGHGVALYAACLALCLLVVKSPVAGAILRPAGGPYAVFTPLLSAKADGDIDPEKTYVIFTRDDEKSVTVMYYLMKYEMFTDDIRVIATNIRWPALGRTYEPDAYYGLENIRMQDADIEKIDDLASAIAEYAEGRDYIVVFCEDSAFDAALEACVEDGRVDAQIVRAYD